MIKVEYILDGVQGNLELSTFGGLSMEEALHIHGSERISDGLAEELLEDVVAVLRPEVESDMCGCEGNSASTENAAKLGFSKLIARFEDKVVFVI